MDTKLYRHLKISVYFGWILILIAIILGVIMGSLSSKSSLSDCIGSNIFFALIILSIRYNIFKPVKIAEGAMASFGLLSVIQYFLHRRVNVEANFMGAWIGFCITLLIGIVVGVIVSIYYLIKETSYLVKMNKKDEVLQDNQSI